MLFPQSRSHALQVLIVNQSLPETFLHLLTNLNISYDPPSLPFLTFTSRHWHLLLLFLVPSCFWKPWEKYFKWTLNSLFESFNWRLPQNNASTSSTSRAFIPNSLPCPNVHFSVEYCLNPLCISPASSSSIQVINPRTRHNLYAPYMSVEWTGMEVQTVGLKHQRQDMDLIQCERS